MGIGVRVRAGTSEPVEGDGNMMFSPPFIWGLDSEFMGWGLEFRV